MMQGPQVAPAMGVFFFVFFFIFGLALGVVLTVVPFWKICTKAGFPGALSLLMLVPIANIILPFYIAFAEWPVLRQMQAGHGGPPQGPGYAT